MSSNLGFHQTASKHHRIINENETKTPHSRGENETKPTIIWVTGRPIGAPLRNKPYNLSVPYCNDALAVPEASQFGPRNATSRLVARQIAAEIPNF